MLEVKGVSKSFGGIKALDNCSLSVRRGTITGLIGPNGAGKTTLFNLIAGVMRPDGGNISFEGEPIEGLPPHEVFSRKLVRTFQISRPLARMTVLENLMIVPEGQTGETLLGAWFRRGVVRRQEEGNREKALAVLDFVRLYPLRDEYAGNLSTGQKKLLELARTMMTDAKLILLDEPGAGVNPTLMKELVARIESLREG
ncbi:MAG: ABC transporter ATP-binding protein, partial [Nitrospinota bacterium]